MQTGLTHNDQNDLQKKLLIENRAFLDAVKQRMPIDDILLQYEKVKKMMDTIRLQGLNNKNIIPE